MPTCAVRMSCESHTGVARSSSQGAAESTSGALGHGRRKTIDSKTRGFTGDTRAAIPWCTATTCRPSELTRVPGVRRATSSSLEASERLRLFHLSENRQVCSRALMVVLPGADPQRQCPSPQSSRKPQGLFCVCWWWGFLGRSVYFSIPLQKHSHHPFSTPYTWLRWILSFATQKVILNTNSDH